MSSTDLPGELIAKPQALIGLSGLDISNTVHRSIWDAFINNRRADGIAVLQFKLLASNPEFPTAKPKRNSYEWYIPKGILKRNWMNKYLNKVPAVVVCFYDLDWNDPTWNEKKMKCASKVQSLKCSLEGRNTKIAVVLIQRGIPPPPGSEDMLATERATALCTACELPAKSLYVLPHGDHLVGYTSRLENVFYELAQNFYHHQYRVVKNHREQLNKTSHQYLFVRHQFKMGFFNELRQDKHLALKHYQHAYNNLLEIRMSDNNTLEVKTVASYINYKLCRLMFIMNQPRDAITQFLAHIDRFKSRTGPEDIIFEHHAWMTNQYSMFAELFDDAIRQGLPPIQTQHPGYYFQLAAQHADLRQKACKELCSNIVPNSQSPSDLDEEEKIEFYGQRPWRQVSSSAGGGGKLAGESVDLAREAAAIQALKCRERNVNHSMIIISLLGNAISQFKIYRCPRMRRQLVVQMAAEYFNARDYGKVLTLLMHMLWEYRSERWPLLLTDILKNALRAAYLATSIQDYITLAIESLGPFTKFSKEDRAVIYSNMMNIIYRKSQPQLIDLTGLPGDVKSSAVEKWSFELNRSDQFICTIDDTNLLSFIDVKARFLDCQYFVASPVNIEVFVKNLYEGSIELSKILVIVGAGGTTIECPATAETQAEGNLSTKFEANETKKFYCTFPTPQQPDGSEMQINIVSLYLGNESNCCIVMKFSPQGIAFSVLDRFYPDLQSQKQWSGGYTFETIKPVITTIIKQEESNLDVQINSSSPALLSEWLPIKVNIKSSENIKNIMLYMKQVSNAATDSSGDHPAAELSLTMANKQSAISVELDDCVNKVEENISIEKIIYVRSHQISQRNFLIKIDYVTDDEIKRSKQLTYSLSIVKPFDITTQFYTRLFEPLTKAFVNEPFIIMPHVVCTSPWPIKILDTSVELGNSIVRNKSVDSDNASQSVLKGTILYDGESGTDVYCVVPVAGSEQPTSTGVYTIRWKRSDSSGEIIETSTSVTLSPVWVEDLVVGLQAKIPAHGWVRTPLCVSYFIKNYSDYLFTLKLTMEASDAFMFAGQKQIDICIPPNNEEKIEWILRPLIAGFVALPTLSLSVPLEDEYKLNKSKLIEILERSLPTHIYIMPKSPTIETQTPDKL